MPCYGRSGLPGSWGADGGGGTGGGPACEAQAVAAYAQPGLVVAVPEDGDEVDVGCAGRKVMRSGGRLGLGF